MKYNKIPNADFSISCIGLGTWVFGHEGWGKVKKEECQEALSSAIDLGINFIDTAPIYGDGLAERIVGQIIKDKRHQLIVATKCGLIKEDKKVIHNLKGESVNEEIEGSLRRLRTDYIDIYQIHWPDPHVPLEETFQALNLLKKEGKVRHIGVSNFSVDLLKKVNQLTELITLQSQYSLLERSLEREILPYCRQGQIGVLSYGALGGGLLTGKYTTQPQFKNSDVRSFFYKFYTEQQFPKIQKRLEQLKQINKPLNQIAINWVRQQPGITSVIVGCRNKRQVEDNISSITRDLSEEEMKLIKNIFP